MALVALVASAAPPVRAEPPLAPVLFRNSGSVSIERVSVAGATDNLLDDPPLEPGSSATLRAPQSRPLTLVAYPEDRNAPRQWSSTLGVGESRVDADYFRVSALRPLYLAVGARIGGGPVAGGTGIATVSVEARVAIELDDFGVGLVGRAGPSWVGRNDFSPYVTTGLVGYEELELALFGMRPTDGFFSRGAYLGFGVGWLGPRSAGPTFTLHQPLVRIGPLSYLGVDLRLLWQMFGSGSSCPLTCGPATDSSPFLVIELGLSWSLAS